MDSNLPAPKISIFIVSNVRVHRDCLTALLRGGPSIDVVGGPIASDSGSIVAQRQLSARMRPLAVGIPETASEVLACAAAGIDG